MNYAKSINYMKHVRGGFLIITLAILTSCPAVPDTVVKNLCGKPLTVHQDNDEWMIPDRGQVLVNSRKSVWISGAKWVAPKMNFMVTIFTDTNETQNRAFIEELLRYPPPHKLMAVIKPDMKIYIQQQNLPRPFRNQPLGFPVQMIPKASP
jgi:hypothetical protein